MSNAKPALGRTRTHTRGGWQIDDSDDRIITIGGDLNANNNYSIAQCYGPDKKANATLIVAAPKTKAQRDALLEACKEIVLREGAYSRDQLTHANNTIENMASIAEAAIALAEKGE